MRPGGDFRKTALRCGRGCGSPAQVLLLPLLGQDGFVLCLFFKLNNLRWIKLNTWLSRFLLLWFRVIQITKGVPDIVSKRNLHFLEWKHDLPKHSGHLGVLLPSSHSAGG